MCFYSEGSELHFLIKKSINIVILWHRQLAIRTQHACCIYYGKQNASMLHLYIFTFIAKIIYTWYMQNNVLVRVKFGR